MKTIISSFKRSGFNSFIIFAGVLCAVLALARAQTGRADPKFISAFAPSSFSPGTSSATLSPSIQNVSSEFPGREAVHTIDGSGLDSSNPPSHDTVATDMWLSRGDGSFSGTADPDLPGQLAHITFNLGGTFSVGSFRVWNYNEFFNNHNFSNRGVNTLTISTSTDGTTFTALTNPATSNTTWTFAQAPGSTPYTGQVVTFAAPVNAAYVRFDIKSNFGPDPSDGVDRKFVGLSEIRFSACAPAPAGMVSWWKAEGNANDSQDDNNGTLQGTVDFVPAEVGQGFSFDSNDDGVVIPHNGNLNITSSGFTADFWIKGTKNQPDGIAAIFEKSHGFVDATGWVFHVDNSGNPSFALGNGSGFPQINGSVDVLDGNFHHIAGTWSSSDNTMRLYVDGVLQGTAGNSSPANNTRTLNIGFAWGGGSPQRFFRGIADELEIFNRALTDAEVTAIFDAGSAGKCPCTPAPDGMISWWRAEGDAVDSKDGNDGTLENGTTFAAGEAGQAFSFNGVDNYVFVPDSPSLNYTDFTYDAWIAPDPSSPAGDNYIIHKGVVGYYVPLIFMTGGAGNQFWEAIIDGTNLNGSAVTYAFQHVAVTREGNVGRLYVDGVLQDTQTVGTGSSAGDNLTFGRITNFGSNFFKGSLDEVEIFNRALTDAEVAAIYNAGSAGKCRSCTPAPGGMISWWKAEGNANDSEDHNNGTFQSGATASGTGKVGQAFDLTANGSYVQVPDSSNLHLGTGEITLDAWIKADPANEENSGRTTTIAAPSSFRTIVGKAGTSCPFQDYEIRINSSNRAEFIATGCGSNGCDCAGFTPVASTSVVADGSFHHVAGVRRANGDQEIYVDGVLENTVNLLVQNTDSSGVLTIGGIGETFSGLVDEVEIFDRALTADEIRKIFDAGSLGKCPCVPPPNNMIAWWPGDDNAKDIQGHHDATLDGATFAPGEVSDAFSFDPSQEQDVDLPDSTDWNFGTGEFTFDFWARANVPIETRPTRVDGPKLSNNNRMYALAFEPVQNTRNLDFDFNDEGNGLWVYWNSGGGVNGTNAIKVGSSGSFTDGRWHHFALTRSGEPKGPARTVSQPAPGWTLYIDGAVAGSANDSEALDLSGATNNFIGAATAGFFWNGQIDEVEIFNRALSGDEVAAIYNAAGAGKCKPQGPDLTATKTNNVGGNANFPNPWTWKISVANKGGDSAVFASGQTILSDNLPNTNIAYGAVTVGNFVNVTNSSAISCSIVSNNLTCTASGMPVTIGAGGSFDVSFQAFANMPGTYANPRAGGGCSVDPNNDVAESDETNNTCADTVSSAIASPTPTATPTSTPPPTPTPTPRPTATPTPESTPTPTPFPATSPFDVDGNGTIAGPHGGQASFSLNVRRQTTGRKSTIVGGLGYDDPVAPLSFTSTKVTTLTFNGNQAHIAGSGKVGKAKVTFTVDVTDNGSPGTNDFFSIHLSTGYSASGNLTSGDLTVH